RAAAARHHPLDPSGGLNEAGEHRCSGRLLLELRTVEEPADPAVVLALGDDLELALVEPGAAVGGTLQHLDAVPLDGLQSRAAARAVAQRLLDHVGPLDALEPCDGFAFLLGEEELLLALLPLLEAVSQTVLAVYHGSSLLPSGRPVRSRGPLPAGRGVACAM